MIFTVFLFTLHLREKPNIVRISVLDCRGIFMCKCVQYMYIRVYHNHSL